MLSKNTLLFILPLVLFALLDFFTRIQGEALSNKTPAPQAPLAAEELVVAKHKASGQSRTEWLAAYDVFRDKVTPEPEANKIAGMSAAEQLNQQGLLQQLYADKQLLTLKAVVAGNKKDIFAVVMARDIETATTAMHQVKLNQELFGYILTAYSQTSITLVRNKQEIELTMFKTRQEK